MKIKQIRKKKLDSPISLIDIGVENDHTFFISDRPYSNYVLTHNSYPDIDSDFSDRDRAVKLLIEYFGEENIVPVSNFVQLQLSSLIKDIARMNNIPFQEVNLITPLVRNEVLVVKKAEEGFDMSTFVLTYEDATKYSKTFNKFLADYPEVENTIKILFKQMRNVSRHAGGVIITDNAEEGMPLIKNGGEMQTPWPEGVNYRHLEEFGLLKFDILGLGTLRVFEDCISKILTKKNKRTPTFEEIRQWFWENLHPDNNNLDDQAVYKHVFHDSNYIGIFQFVQENTQKFMAKMKPTKVSDIAVATSIFRPGPLSLDVDKRFLENRANPSKVRFKHPLLEEVFAETSGLLVFQEQLQMIYHKLAGVPLEDTDSVRKAFTKKEINNKAKAEEDRRKLRDTFISLCEKTNSINPRDSGEIFDEMEKLVAYSFNKSHAMAYAITSYQAAWFLTYYPEEWVTSYIDYCTLSKGKVSGKEDPKAVAIKEAKTLGYKIVKADINHSDYHFTVDPKDNKTLIPGFASLKYVGKSAVEEIKAFRPYKDIKDLLLNANGAWKHSKFNKRSLETLIKLETFDSLDLVGTGKTFKNYREMCEFLIGNYDKLKKATTRKKNKDFDRDYNECLQSVKEQKFEDWSRKEKMEIQKTLAGSVDFNLLVTPEVYATLEKLNYESIDNWMEKGNYWAIVSSAVISTTKTGNKYLKLRIYAEENREYNCSVWNWKDDSSLNLTHGDVIVGQLDKDNFGFKTFNGKIFKLNQ